uniref:uncharacterized protein LOC120347853 isoform X2 n=1 Tax=Styela clava TaxID=7725 RepID=UPI00193A3972|nr:uncharacterized protein LOC120347853 isoform X2 [Styela clava]XP_039273896.1 uncharacterized protein LOC120347853 isoform X2 [Styela clava]
MQRFFVSIMLSAAVMLILLDGTYGQSDFDGECWKNEDCGLDQFCDGIRCIYTACEGDKDCDSSQFCSMFYELYGYTISGECRTIECEVDEDCYDSDQNCNHLKKCYYKDHECYRDSECENNQYCERMLALGIYAYRKTTRGRVENTI